MPPLGMHAWLPCSSGRNRSLNLKPSLKRRYFSSPEYVGRLFRGPFEDAVKLQDGAALDDLLLGAQDLGGGLWKVEVRNLRAELTRKKSIDIFVVDIRRQIGKNDLNAQNLIY